MSDLSKLLEAIHADIPDEAWVKVARQMAREQFMPVKDAPKETWVLAWMKDWVTPMPSVLSKGKLGYVWCGYDGDPYDDDQPTHFCFWPELPE